MADQWKNAKSKTKEVVVGQYRVEPRYTRFHRVVMSGGGQKRIDVCCGRNPGCTTDNDDYDDGDDIEIEMCVNTSLNNIPQQQRVACKT